MTIDPQWGGMRLFTLTGLAAITVVVAVPGAARPAPEAVQRVRLPAQPLRAALQGLARLYQIELLFSNDAIGDASAHAMSGTYRIEEALAVVLAGSGLVVRRSASGGYVVVRGDDSATVAVQAPVPEIVVMGRRTQNADIRRFTNDIQPYQVLTRDDIRAAHASTLEELIGKRMSTDARGLSFSQTPLSGQASPQSTVNLRGLGADETLVLLDGRRLPRLPGQRLEFVQPDVNALSPESIERVEVATSTAGGIYGPGAIAGVVNLVLSREYRGAELAVTGGLTQRGDAPQARIDARVGFTPDHGATDVMLSYSRSSRGGLRADERDFGRGVNDRILSTIAAAYQYGDLPVSNSVNIAGSGRKSLTLKNEFGGGALGSFITTLPPGDARSTAQTIALLRANAGRLDTTPSDSQDGGQRSLTVAQDTSAILANIRHQFGGVELYGDFVRLIDKGAVTGTSYGAFVQMPADDPRNPFQQTIDLSLPFFAYRTTTRQRIVTTRASLGVVAGLPGGWKGNVDLSLGAARQEIWQAGTTPNINAYLQLAGFAPPGQGALDPFGDAMALQAALTANVVPFTTASRQTNRMSDLSLRLSGPVVALPGGAVFATLLAEQRHERVAPTTAYRQSFGIQIPEALRGYGERVRSAYVELRAPLFPEHMAFAPLRGLELQIAARVDATRVDASPDPSDDRSIPYDRYRSAERAAVVYTAGLKARPLPGLLLRASFATGEMAPPLAQLARAFVQSRNTDPKRGNQIIALPAYRLIVFKDPLVPERAQTFSAGFIATPWGAGGPKLSLDYSRIRRSREAGGTAGFALTYLLYEDLYPGRVTRLPLTPDDAAKGYTGGVITQIDASYTTIGWTRIDAVDARVDLPLPSARRGDVNLYAAVTWQPTYERFLRPQNSSENLTNRLDGALALRGNAGLGWTKGPLQLGLSAQYYGGYNVLLGSTLIPSLNLRYLARQGAARIPASVTLDLSAAYRVAVPGDGARPRALDIRFGIQDLLDRHPAILVGEEGGYSLYADPRRRRFELTLALSI